MFLFPSDLSQWEQWELAWGWPPLPECAQQSQECFQTILRGGGLSRKFGGPGEELIVFSHMCLDMRDVHISILCSNMTTKTVWCFWIWLVSCCTNCLMTGIVSGVGWPRFGEILWSWLCTHNFKGDSRGLRDDLWGDGPCSPQYSVGLPTGTHLWGGLLWSPSKGQRLPGARQTSEPRFLILWPSITLIEVMCALASWSVIWWFICVFNHSLPAFFNIYTYINIYILMPCGTAWRPREEASLRAVSWRARVVLQQRTFPPHPPQGHLCHGRHYSGLTSKIRLDKVVCWKARG